MPLISLADGLAHAREHRYALGAFNVLDSHFLRALFAAARQENSPFIINIAEVHFKYVSLDSLVEAVKFEAARHDIPVVLNLDHGLHFEAVVRALRLGFSSVMFDGSTLSYEENIRQTREVVKMCHAVGVSVEAELGAVGGDEGGALYGHADEALFTDPLRAREFVDQTGIDALAVAIGNAHGKYKGEPKLDFARLDAIRQQTGLPLVLHGGSGISDADFRRAIELGIHKINFYTGMSQAALAAVEQRMANRQPLYDEFAELLLGIEGTPGDYRGGQHAGGSCSSDCAVARARLAGGDHPQRARHRRGTAQRFVDPGENACRAPAAGGGTGWGRSRRGLHYRHARPVSRQPPAGAAHHVCSYLHVTGDDRPQRPAYLFPLAGGQPAAGSARL
jgi:fructose-bisphosphate aldolase class II